MVPNRPFTAEDVTKINLYHTNGEVVEDVTISKAALDVKLIFFKGEAFVLDKETNRYVAEPYYIHTDITI